MPGVESGMEFDAGVVVPDMPPLEAFADGVEVERPLAACAYEKPAELPVSAREPALGEAIASRTYADLSEKPSAED